MSQTVELPNDLKRAVFNAGPRKIVLVEGINDKYTFEFWFPYINSEVIFYDCGGKGKVEKWLDTFLKQSQRNIYGIRDRDLNFSDFKDIADCYDEEAKDVRLFVLRRRNLENYLIEPSVVYGVFKAVLGRKCEFDDATEAKQALINVAKELRYVTAANIVIYEHNTPLAKEEDDMGYILTKHLNESNKAEIIAVTAQKLKLSKAEVERRITPKLESLNVIAEELEKAHEQINGKRFLIALKKMYNFPLPVENLYNLLCDRIAQQKTIHPDIIHIIQTRILERHEA